MSDTCLRCGIVREREGDTIFRYSYPEGSHPNSACQDVGHQWDQFEAYRAGLLAFYEYRNELLRRYQQREIS